MANKCFTMVGSTGNLSANADKKSTAQYVWDGKCMDYYGAFDKIDKNTKVKDSSTVLLLTV